MSLIFSTHPPNSQLSQTLMVGGFFSTQLLAILSWTVITTPAGLGKACHVFLQTAALITMAVGLYAVQKYKVCICHCSWLVALVVALRSTYIPLF